MAEDVRDEGEDSIDAMEDTYERKKGELPDHIAGHIETALERASEVEEEQQRGKARQNVRVLDEDSLR